MRGTGSGKEAKSEGDWAGAPSRDEGAPVRGAGPLAHPASSTARHSGKTQVRKEAVERRMLGTITDLRRPHGALVRSLAAQWRGD